MDLKTDSLSELWIGTIFRKDDVLNSLNLLTATGMTEKQAIITLKKLVCNASALGGQVSVTEYTASILNLCG